MVYHKKKGMKTMKVRKLKRKTRRHKRRLGGRGSVFSSIMDSSDTNTDKKHSKTEKHSNKTEKRPSNLKNTIKVMDYKFNQKKPRSGTFTTRNNKKNVGTKRKRKTSLTESLSNKKRKTSPSTESSSDIPKPKPGHVPLNRIILNPEPRRAAKPPTDSDDSN